MVFVQTRAVLYGPCLTRDPPIGNLRGLSRTEVHYILHETGHDFGRMRTHNHFRRR